ncbi:MAG TPA: WD40 repeat domain-containing protein, partial [Enhygromyxa sp.]|nr:WD40 repeat domain-containing protein [Enhygromyxa sp.]
QLGYLAACDKELKVWRLGDEHAPVVHVALDKTCDGLRVSPDERRLAYSLGVSTALIDLGSGATLAEVEHPGDFSLQHPNTVAWTSDQGHVLTRHEDWVAVRHPGTLAVEGRLRTGTTITLAVAPDGKTFAVASPERVSIAQIEDAAELRTLAVAGARVLEFSPDGSWLAVGLESGAVRLWSLPDFAHEQLVGHTATVASLEFGPNDLLVSGSDDDTAIVWELGGTWTSTRFERHRSDVIFARLLDNGRDLVTVGDSELRLWCVEAQR